MNTRHTWKKKDFWLAGTLDATFGVFFLKHRWCKQSFSVCTLFFHTSAPGAFCGFCPGSRTHTMWDFRRRAILALTVQMNHWGFPGPAFFWGGRGGRTIFDVNIHFHNEKFPIFIFAWRLVWHFLLVLSLSYQRKHVLGDIFGQDLLYIKGFNPQPRRNLANTGVSVPSAPFQIVSVCIKQMGKHQTISLIWDVLRGGFGVLEIHKTNGQY